MHSYTHLLKLFLSLSKNSLRKLSCRKNSTMKKQILGLRLNSGVNTTASSMINSLLECSRWQLGLRRIPRSCWTPLRWSWLGHWKRRGCCCCCLGTCWRSCRCCCSLCCRWCWWVCRSSWASAPSDRQAATNCSGLPPVEGLEKIDEMITCQRFLDGVQLRRR